MDMQRVRQVADGFDWHIRVFGFLMLFAGVLAAGPREMHMVPYPDQELEFESGVGVVVSEGRYGVAAKVEGIDRKTAWVEFVVYNDTDKSVTVMDDSIEATSAEGPLVVLRADDILRKEKRRQTWEAVGAGLVAGANAYNAGQAGAYTERGTYRGRVDTYGSSGTSSSRVRGTYTASGTDPVATQLAIQRASADNQQLIASLGRSQASREAALKADLFQAETIEPNTYYGGRLQIVLPKRLRKESQLIQLAISVDGERHPFFVALDGKPSAAQLAHVASLSARPIPESTFKPTSNRPVKIEAVLRRFVIQDRPTDDPELLDKVAVLDIAWTTTDFNGVDPIKGMLHLRDEEGLGVDLFWEIAADHARAGRYFEEGAEQLLYVDSEASDWLLRQAAVGNRPNATFAVGQPK
jgi:hypothetical protein